MFSTDIAKRFLNGIVALSMVFTPVTPSYSQQPISSPYADAAIMDRIAAAHAAVPHSTDPSQFLYGQVASAAQQAIVHGLNSFGTAKVQLDAQGGGSLDLLLPLRDDADSLWFFQGGVRRSDQLYKDYRTILNAGLGYRHFINDNAMIGINGFFDADVTGGNRRLGVGAEYWADYLKLSTNGYFGLNRVWGDSPDLPFYSEKPASGFDVTAQGYLPQFPQLGAKLSFEKYFGDEVGLFGYGNLQKNPHAYTFGLTYQPAPALTFDVSHRMGQDGKNDTTFRVGLNFKFGVPLNKQFDFSPEAVAPTREVRNMRYDLVERNNNIVLKYKQQADNFAISLPDSISGHPGERITFPITITDGSCNAIAWEGSAAGFVQSCNGSEVTIKLPDTNVCAVHDLSASAKSRQGRTVRASTKVSILCAASILVSAEPASITADGKSTSTLTATVKDANGDPMRGVAVDWTTTAGTLAENSTTTDRTGKATVMLTSAIEPGTATVTAKSGPANGSADVAFVAGDAASVSVVANPTSIVANGSSTSALTATVKDASGNPVPGATVTWTTSAGSITAASTTDASGVATATLTSSTTAGTATVTAKAGTAQGTASVTFTVGPAASVSVSANPTSIPANGSSTSALTATVRDAYGNLVPGTVVTWTTSAGTVVASSTTNASGVATSTLTSSTTAGTATVTAKAGTAQGTASVTFTATGPAPGTSYDWSTFCNSGDASYDPYCTLTFNANYWLGAGNWSVNTWIVREPYNEKAIINVPSSYCASGRLLFEGMVGGIVAVCQ